MKIYNTVDDYLQKAKPDDIIVLGGAGVIDGIATVESKHDTYKVHKNTTKDRLVIRGYRGRKNLVLGANAYDQKVGVLSKKEFKQLPTLW